MSLHKEIAGLSRENMSVKEGEVVESAQRTPTLLESPISDNSKKELDDLAKQIKDRNPDLSWISATRRALAQIKKNKDKSSKDHPKTDPSKDHPKTDPSKDHPKTSSVEGKTDSKIKSSSLHEQSSGPGFLASLFGAQYFTSSKDNSET